MFNTVNEGDRDTGLNTTNPGQLGLGSSRPESSRPGQVGLYNLIIDAAHVSFYSCIIVIIIIAVYCMGVFA